LHLALADEMSPDHELLLDQCDDVVPLRSLNIPSWRGWAFCHNIVELSTAIKPFMLSRLLKLSGTAKVFYLDPDIVVFSKLDDMLESLDEANIVLTPHQTIPEQRLTAIIDNEICSLKHGIYNLGFFGVAATEVGQEFSDWWCQRVYHFCRADISNGLFTDQRWIDLVPAFFSGTAINRSNRHNVATWNLTTRNLSVSESGQYQVDGEPLGFYHFTGFDSGAHQIMALKNACGNHAVQKLIDWYTGQTKHLGEDPLAKQPWAFGAFSDGTPINRAQRLVYRERVDLQKAFPNPFDASGYLQWWHNQGALEYPRLSDSPDDVLANLFPGLTPGYRAGLVESGWSKTGDLIKRAIINPSIGAKLAQRSWEIIKNEGLGGLRKRLAN
jgi:hypothetical protein